MTRWFVVVVAVLAACKASNDKCSPAKKEALAALENAVTDAGESQRLEKDLSDAASLARSYAPGAESLTADLNLFEQSLGCAEHVDCCARLAKRNNRAEISSHAMDLERTAKPPALASLVSDLWALLDKAEHIAPKEIEPWCKQVLVQVARVRSQGPGIWKQASEDANKRLSEAKAAVDARVRRDAEVGEWRVAISGSKQITVAPDLGDGSVAFRRAREAVEHYQTACH